MEDDERIDLPRPHRTNENVEKIQNLVYSNRFFINQDHYVEIMKRSCEDVKA